MPTPKTTDSRQATSERNSEAILDAAERLLRDGGTAPISAVATEAGLSRVTVYSHFSDRSRMIEAVVERTVRRVTEAITAADIDRGPAVDALQRLVKESWIQLAGNHDIRRVASAELSADAMRRVHGPVHGVVDGLIQRGRDDGSFRTDVTKGWLIVSMLALVHAAVDEVRAARAQAEEALEALLLTITDLFAGRGLR
jgi:TetR/AcrR family transcriptional repressor of mexCD-oprJ operon